MVAAERGDVEMTRLLLSHGANREGSGTSDTPLMLAASSGHMEIARLLLDHGADVNAEHNHRTALDVAEKAEMAKLLRSRGGKSWYKLPSW